MLTTLYRRVCWRANTTCEPGHVVVQPQSPNSQEAREHTNVAGGAGDQDTLWKRVNGRSYDD